MPELQQMISVAEDWSVADIKSTLREHETGNFFRSSMLADHMGRDPWVSSLLETLCLGVLRLPFRVLPSSTGDQRVAPAAAKRFSDEWYDIAPLPVQREIVEWLVQIGVSLGQNVWDKALGRPRLESWHLQHLRRDEWAGKWLLQTRKGEIEIKPGDGEWVLLSLGGDRGWMKGAVRRVAQDWLNRQYTKSDWNDHQEARGQGIRKAIVPLMAEDGDKKKFTDAAANIGTGTVIECPQDENGKGWDLQHEEPKGEASIGFQRFLSECRTEITVAYLGQDAGIKQPGVYVPAEHFGRITRDRLDSLASTISPGLYEHLSVPWAVYNYDDATLAPWPEWDSKPPVDKQAQAQLLKTLSEAGWVADEQEVKAWFGMSLTRKQPAPGKPSAQGAA